MHTALTPSIWYNLWMVQNPILHVSTERSATILKPCVVNLAPRLYLQYVCSESWEELWATVSHCISELSHSFVAPIIHLRQYHE